MKFNLDFLRKIGLSEAVDFVENGGSRTGSYFAITENQVQMLEDIIEAAFKHPYYNIASTDDGVYMERDWLIEKSATAPAARVHKILRSDLDRHLHDHPWNNVSVLLEGGYWEVMPAEDSKHDLSNMPEHIRPQGKFSEPLQAVQRGRGDVILRLANQRHRLIIEQGTFAKSLFISAVKSKEWGFYTEAGFIHHEEYLLGESSTDRKAV